MVSLLMPASCRAQDSNGPRVSLRDHGGIGDGATDNGAALSRALAEAARLNLPLEVPPGIFVVEDTHVHQGLGGFVPHAGARIYGAGPESRLRFRRSAFRSFYGLDIRHDNISLRDLAVEMDNHGGDWTAGICITASVRQLLLTRVTFRGIGDRAGHYGVMPLNADVVGLGFQECHFEKLDFGLLKMTSDVSSQTGISLVDCTGRDCTEIVELNSPGLFRGSTRAGSPVVASISDDHGEPFDTAHLVAGQEVRSVLFPAGTRVASVDGPARVTLSAPALATSPAGNKARFSAGGCRGGVIRNLRVVDIGQWPVGLAHCENWEVEVYGEEVGYELVHVEDGSSRLRIVAGGRRCNLRPGVVGSPGADNGMVHIASGSHDIEVHFADADLRASQGPNAVALCVQAAGVMGTTGAEVNPRGITVGGRVLLKAGTRAIVAYDTDIRFAALELINPDPASRADPMLKLYGCTWTGSLRVHNPGTLVDGNARSRGRFDAVNVLPD